jgi:hypothetical protein
MVSLLVDVYLKDTLRGDCLHFSGAGYDPQASILNMKMVSKVS